MKYRVRFYQDNEYEVVELKQDSNGIEYELSCFQGSLADCEAWIRLHSEGYM